MQEMNDVETTSQETTVLRIEAPNGTPISINEVTIQTTTEVKEIFTIMPYADGPVVVQKVSIVVSVYILCLLKKEKY